MCPQTDAAPNGDEMVPINTSSQPHIPESVPAGTNGTLPETNGHPQTNGDANHHSAPPKVKSHQAMYGRASDFLSNTSNWKVCVIISSSHATNPPLHHCSDESVV